MKTFICLAFLSFINTFCASAQDFDGTFLSWGLVKNTDPRVKIKFASTGINSADWEGTTVLITNTTSTEIYIEVKVKLFDYCGNELERTIKTSIKPNGKIGGNTWMGGSEQHCYSTECKEFKKYGDRFYTRLRHVEMSIEKITSNGENASPNDKPEDKGDATSYYDDVKNKTTSSDTGKQNSQNFWGTTTVCNAQAISIANTIGINCIQLSWLSQETIQYNSTSNDIKTNFMSDNFVLAYKKVSDITWREINIKGYFFSYNLGGLSPCSDYEVKIKRDCGSGNFSAFSNSILFSTRCPAPSGVYAKNINKTSASIGSMFSPGINICDLSKPSYTINIEYCTQGLSWQTVISTASKGGSVLYNLSPNTTYRVRVRYDYGNQIFSKYSNEVSFTTLK